MAKIIAFKQRLQPQHLGSCLTEVLKYVLYTKGQVPLPYEQLLKTKAAGKSWQDTKASGTCGSSKSSWKAKRFRDRLDKLQQLFSTVQSACSAGGSTIREAVIILGGTLVSPKAVYRIEIEGEFVNKDAESLSPETLRRYVVKNLIGISLEAGSTRTPLTNCFVLLLAPRSSNFGANLLPRMAFKVLHRGSHAYLKLCEFELESIGTTLCPPPSQDESCGQEQLMPVGGIEDGVISLLKDLQLAENKAEEGEYIWFQISTVFRGFQELPFLKSVAISNIWD